MIQPHICLTLEILGWGFGLIKEGWLVVITSKNQRSGQIIWLMIIGLVLIYFLSSFGLNLISVEWYYKKLNE